MKGMFLQRNLTPESDLGNQCGKLAMSQLSLPPLGSFPQARWGPLPGPAQGLSECKRLDMRNDEMMSVLEQGPCRLAHCDGRPGDGGVS